jgi:RNA polymerase sigma factor (sigma-70 family)
MKFATLTNMIVELVEQYLLLAKKIAGEFDNIPGLSHEEIEMSAQEALLKAAQHFKPEVGDFTSFASVVIRNALRDLYERQVRHHQHHVYDLNIPCNISTTAEDRIHRIPDPHVRDVNDAAACRESDEKLALAIETLSPRLRVVAEGIGAGKSYSEIGAELGISKQAAHKLAGAAMATLREKLDAMGFSGVDTLGLLKSHSIVHASSSCIDDCSPQP